MKPWLNALINKWPDLLITIVGVFGGTLLSYITIKHQRDKELSDKREAYLTNLLHEFEYNLKVLRRVERFVDAGPNIDHLWAPAEANSNALMVDAWNELIKAGILPTIDKNDRIVLRIANRTVMDVKRLFNEISANWVRIEEWHRHDMEKENQLLSSRKLYKETALREASESLKYSIEQLKLSVDRLKLLTES